MMIILGMFLDRGTFRDRKDAGQQLAAQLGHLKEAHPVVLALPRGGVPIGAEVAAALDAPLDLMIVRKLGAPRQPELAVGAVVDGEHPETVLNEDVVAFEGLSEADIAALRKHELTEIARRRKDYLGDHPYVALEGRTAIVVDDGIATGATVRAALKGARRRNPAHLVLAVPVAAPSTIKDLKAEVDEVICLLQPADLFAVGFYYQDFTQVSDGEVRTILDRQRSKQNAGRDEGGGEEQAP